MHNQAHRQLFLDLLKETAQHKSIHKMEKNPEQVLDRLATRLQRRSEQMRYNKNKAAQFCLHQMEKSKNNPNPVQLHRLEQIKVNQCLQNSNSYFRTQCSQVYSSSYTYLKSSKYLYMFNRAFLPVGQQFTVTFILTQAQMQYVISYVQLCMSLRKLVRCMMPRSLWPKVKDVLQIVWGKYVFQLFSPETLLLFNEQKAGSFDFEDSILIFNKNLWCWDSFNAHLIIKGMNYLIEGPAITDEQRIYAAWRKDVIDEPEYCRLIDNTLKANVVWSNNSKEDHSIKQQCVHYTIQTILNYRSFTDCQLFSQVDQDTIQQIYLCGEIVEYIQGQIVYKANTILDKIFVVLEGQLQIIHEQANEIQPPHRIHLNASNYFRIQSLTEEIGSFKKSLQISSPKAIVFSIPLWKIKYLLGHELQIVKDINQYPSQVLKDWKSNSLSEWMRKVIKYVNEKSRNLSENTSKLVGAEKLKISTRLWREICHKDLSLLYQTHEQIGSDL